MPHDKHGRLIQVGDVVKAKPYNYGGGAEAVGRVVVMREGQTCSGDAAFFTRTYDPAGAPLHPCKILPTIDAFGAEEAEIILKADGSLPETPASS